MDPTRHIGDNLSKSERNFLKNIKEMDNIIYKWEDKGPSLTKMSMDQYIVSGEKELENGHFYKQIAEDPSNTVKQKNNNLFQKMLAGGEISEPVADFLQGGGKKLSSFYHLLKTHKIPVDLDSPNDWLANTGYPLRGIISGRGPQQKDWPVLLIISCNQA